MNTINIKIVVFLFILLLTQKMIANGGKENLNLSQNEISNKLLLQYNFNDSEVFTKLNIKNEINESREELSTKSPWLAFFLSVPISGLGQLYNGDYLKATIQGAIFIGGVSLLSGCGEGCGSGGGAGIVLGVVGATWLWSIIDAPISANRNNSRIKRQKGLTIIQSANEKYKLKLHRDSFSNTYSLNLQVGL